MSYETINTQSLYTEIAKAYFGDGSVLFPSLTFASDIDTGLYRIGGNQLGFSIGGINKLIMGVNITSCANLLPNITDTWCIGSNTYPFKESYFGSSSSNYTKIDDTGVTLVGTARRYKCIAIHSLSAKPGGTLPPVGIIDDRFPYHEYSIGDFASGVLEIPKDADLSANIEAYVGWFIDEAYATNSGEIQWQLSMRAVSPGEIIDSGGCFSDFYSGDIDIPAAAKTYQLSLVGTIPGSSLLTDNEIGGYLKRIAINDGNNPTAKPRAMSVMLKYCVKQMGE